MFTRFQDFQEFNMRGVMILNVNFFHRLNPVKILLQTTAEIRAVKGGVRH